MVSIYGEVAKIGRTSITIALETVVQRRHERDRHPGDARHLRVRGHRRGRQAAAGAAGRDGMKRLVAVAARRGRTACRRRSPRRIRTSGSQQLVRVVAKDGKYTHVEIEWRFDPFSSEIEIPLIDENKDGKFSAQEVKVAGRRDDAGAEEVRLPDLAQYRRQGFPAATEAGFLRPHRRSGELHAARMGSRGRRQCRHGRCRPTRGPTQPEGPRKKGPRNLVYIMRFDLPEPSKSFSIATYDPEDFMRIEVDKASRAGWLHARQASDPQGRVRARLSGLRRHRDVPASVKPSRPRPALAVPVDRRAAVCWPWSAPWCSATASPSWPAISAEYQRRIQQVLSTSLQRHPFGLRIAGALDA